MAKGWDGIEQQTVATIAARDQAQQNSLPRLTVNEKNPGPVQIRFLEQGQDVNNYPVHEYKVPNPQGGNPFNRNFTCLTEAGLPSSQCPGCVAGLKRKRRGVYNVIQRQRAILRKDKDGRAIKMADGSFIVDGHADEVVIANVGGPTAEMLRQTDGSQKGLMSRDYTVTYSGSNFQAWTLQPAFDSAGNAIATPLSEADLELASKKYDLDAYMKPPSVQEANEIVQRYGGNSGVSAPQPAQPAVPANPMLAGADLSGSPYNALGAVTGQQQ